MPGTVSITDADGNELPPGEMGEVWLRNPRDTPTYRYVGAEAAHATVAGSRSATWATSTPTATCTWATAPPT